MSDEDLKAELERLRAENDQLKNKSVRGLSLKVSEKGAVSLYGVGRFPVTLYKEQWAKVLGMKDEIENSSRQRPFAQDEGINALPGSHSSRVKSLLGNRAIVTLLLVSSCRKQATPGETTELTPSGPHDPDLSVSAAGYHGNHFSGPVYIPRSSPMEEGTTAYNVTYQDGVTVISRGDTMRHLVAIRRDGSYVFDSSAIQIANLQPGSVLLLSGLALCTVVEVKDTGDGYLLKTGPAKITDAIKNGRLEGTYRIDFSRMQAGKPSSSQEGWLTLMWTLAVTITTSNSRRRRIASRCRRPLNLEAARERWRMKAVGYLSNFVSTIKMQIKDGELTNLSFTNSDLGGQVELKWFAVATDALKPGSMAKITSWPAELLKSAPLSKAAYHVPILVGAVPFDLRISLGFSFIPAFTSKNSVV